MSGQELKAKLIDEATKYANTIPEGVTPDYAAGMMALHFRAVSEQWRADRVQEEHNAKKDDPVQQAAERGFNS